MTEGTYQYGNAFKHFIIAEIIRSASYLFPDWRFSYIQTGAGAEIDLIIDRPGLPYAIIEIKYSNNIDERDIRVLDSFTSDFDSPLSLCISRDTLDKQIRNVTCFHWKKSIEILFGKASL